MHPAFEPDHAAAGRIGGHLTREYADELLETTRSPARDAGSVACAQVMPHDGMARHGTVAARARAIGQEEAGGVLTQMLEANKNAGPPLNEFATQTPNPQAMAPEPARPDTNPARRPKSKTAS